MRNWKEGSQYKRILPHLRAKDTLTMPEIATGAFRLQRGGETYKIRYLENKGDWESMECAHGLLARGFKIPKICDIQKLDNNNGIAFIEWIEGETALEYRNRTNKLPEEFYHKLGRYIAKMHCEMTDGTYISSLAWWPRNMIITDNLEPIFIDLNKLYYTDFPECFTIKAIVAETPTVSKEQVDAFLAGYREIRKYDLEKIFAKYYSLFKIDYDVYLYRKLFLTGEKRFWEEWNKMNLPQVMDGTYVLDIDYGSGMFSLECALRGAKRVFAYSAQYVNIGRAHHRMSDIGKLLSVYHGFTENNLLYKHTDTDTEWFKKAHIQDTLRYILNKKYDLAFAPLSRKEELNSILTSISGEVRWKV